MAKGRLLIGWCRGDITPQRKTFVAGQFHTRISDKVISPLTVTALALEVRSEDGSSEQAVFLSCDLANELFKTELLKKLNGRCAGLDLRKITISCTHTHNGPALKSGAYEEPADDPEFLHPDEYRLQLVEQAADTIASAWDERKPGSISRGFGYAVVGRCRRAVYADGTAMMYGRTDLESFSGFESCNDNAVNMLFTWNEGGDLSGILVNLACPAQCQEIEEFFSADFWHNVRAAVAERYGADVHLLPQCAPAGDFSPHLLADQKEEHDLRTRIGLDDRGIIARRIMAAVDEGLSSASEKQAETELVHEVRTLHLPRKMVTKEEYEHEKRIRGMSKEELEKQPYGFKRVWPFSLISDLVARYEQQNEHPEHVIEMHVIRIGDAVFATNPFELFADYGMRIRCRSKALQTFLVQLADGSGDGGYLPTQRALDGGHYSALTKSNWVGPEGGAVLVEETLQSINTLFKDKEYPRTQ